MCMICKLIANAKKENKDSMMELISLFNPLIKKYTYKLNYEDAKSDLIVNLIKLIYDMPEFSNDGQAVAYIKKSMHHFYIKYVKEQISLRENECTYDPDVIKNMRNASEEFSEPKIDLYSAISRLSEKQRCVIIQKFIYMMPDKEIMSRLNLSRQAVYKNKMKAIEKLKEMLDNDF